MSISRLWRTGNHKLISGPRIHYHLLAACIADKNAEFDEINGMLITENDKRSFKEPHKRLIYDEFKL